MSIVDGNPVNAAYTNARMMSKQADNSIQGYITTEKFYATQKTDVATSATINALSSASGFIKMTGSTVTLINGVADGLNGKEIIIYNASSALVTLVHQAGGATAADRMVSPTAANVELAANFSAILKYDSTLQRWIIISSGTGGGGTGTGTVQAAVLASTSNLTLSGEQTIDGTTTSNSRVLAAGQSDPSENGMYVTDAGAWTRASDVDEEDEFVQGMQIYVQNGIVNGHSVFVLRSPGPVTVDTTPLNFYKLNEWYKQRYLLAVSDITNQYVDLDYEVAPYTSSLNVDGTVYNEGNSDDYTLTDVGGVSRLMFEGQLASTGGAALVDGQVLQLKYQIKRND